MNQPPVITWFKVYAGFMAFLYFAITAIVGVIAVIGPEDEEMSRTESMVIFGLVAALCGIFCAVFAFALFAPRAPWVWIYDIVLIALGMTSCLTLPAAIPLLIFWLKPEAKAWFGRT